MLPGRLGGVAAVLAVLSCSSSSSSSSPMNPAEPSESVIPHVVALGDSLTAGPGLRPGEAYPALLQDRIRRAGLPDVVINAGVSGETTSDALARLERALTPETRVLIVALGANDGLRGVPVAMIERNLDTILQRARDRNVRVLLCGMHTPPARSWDYTLAFGGIYPELARRHDAVLMPFLLAGVVGRPDLNLDDGWHPNAAGMQVIASNMWPYLEPLLGR
jgi:acyl-CoA thioesterase-1